MLTNLYNFCTIKLTQFKYYFRQKYYLHLIFFKYFIDSK